MDLLDSLSLMKSALASSQVYITIATDFLLTVFTKKKFNYYFYHLDLQKPNNETHSNDKLGEIVRLGIKSLLDDNIIKMIRKNESIVIINDPKMNLFSILAERKF